MLQIFIATGAMSFFVLKYFQKNLILASATLGFSLYSLPNYAQINSDNTVNTRINKIGDRQVISGGKKVGTNLFHSFSQFSVPNNITVHFDNDFAIKNIFSRVTGGGISEINGAIKANGNASLFLLNPAGIIFGANAQLNLGGSFIATTANSIIFADGIEFSANSSLAQPLLTVSIPIGLQYGTAPGKIRSFSSNLSILPGNTLALLGGDILLEKTTLSANSGRIEIGTVSQGEVSLQPTSKGWKLGYEKVKEFGQIAIAQKTEIDTSGTDGIVQFQGENINFTEGSVITNFTLSDKNGGSIYLIAKKSIKLDNSFLFTQVGFNPEINITGNGGNILIQTEQLTVNNGSLISAGTLSQGNGGNLTVNATNLVEVVGQDKLFPSILTTSTAGEGTGGVLTINTNRLIVKDGGQIEAATFGQGQAGTIIVKATESIELLGNATLGDGRVFSSGLFAASGFENLSFDLQPAGKSGNLIVNTAKLSLAEGAQISVNNFGLENGGDIKITAGELAIAPDSEISATTASGKGGAIDLKLGSLLLMNGGKISTSAARNGDGGNINIIADTIVLLGNSTIRANAFAGVGGNINIRTEGLFIDPDSQITASSDLSKDGIVEIITPDLESTLNLTESERSPLRAEDLLYSSCNLGGNFADNQFNYIGRGGLPLSPLEELLIEDTLIDLGTIQPEVANIDKIPQSEKLSFANRSQTKTVSEEKIISEATNWIVNEKGNLELIAQVTQVPQLQKFLCLSTPK